ncbi:MAG: p-hydroxycinnamoyl CoA hydratase/lyase [Alphaproteobacteria bacterium]|nr:p-hydroxycinnamoyl CoA hydratase/lyase [Alphaproteobacteria bacterium]
MAKTKEWKCVKVDWDSDGITWVTFNRPEKRNAMSPQLHYDMEQVMLELETDPDCKVIVISGAGNSWSAGMDLKEYFRETDNNPQAQFRSFTSNRHWSWEMLINSRKPSIAMVNGYCFGGAFVPLCNCDIVVTAEDAIYGLSEVNWGIIPGGIVSKVIVDTMAYRDAQFYAMTGRTFDGKQAVQMKLANIAVPKEKLREETAKLARELMEKNPIVLAYTKQAVRAVRTMDVQNSYEYLMTKIQALRFMDKAGTRETGMREFLDKKTYKPGFQSVKAT